MKENRTTLDTEYAENKTILNDEFWILNFYLCRSAYIRGKTF